MTSLKATWRCYATAWLTLLFNEGVIELQRKLQAAALRAEQTDPQGFESTANVKLFRALSDSIRDVLPAITLATNTANATHWGLPYRH